MTPAHPPPGTRPTCEMVVRTSFTRPLPPWKSSPLFVRWHRKASLSTRHATPRACYAGEAGPSPSPNANQSHQCQNPNQIAQDPRSDAKSESKSESKIYFTTSRDEAQRQDKIGYDGVHT